MTRTVPAAILAAAALFSGTAALATVNPVQAAQHSATTRHVTTTKVAGKPVAARATTTTRTTTTARAPGGQLVKTKTTTGKSVTYDCSKAGNKTKAACKK